MSLKGSPTSPHHRRHQPAWPKAQSLGPNSRLVSNSGIFTNIALGNCIENIISEAPPAKKVQHRAVRSLIQDAFPRHKPPHSYSDASQLAISNNLLLSGQFSSPSAGAHVGYNSLPASPHSSHMNIVASLALSSRGGEGSTRPSRAASPSLHVPGEQNRFNFNWKRDYLDLLEDFLKFLVWCYNDPVLSCLLRIQLRIR